MTEPRSQQTSTLRPSSWMVLLLFAVPVVSLVVALGEPEGETIGHMQRAAVFPYGAVVFGVGFFGYLALLIYRTTRFISVDDAGLSTNGLAIPWANVARYELDAIPSPTMPGQLEYGSLVVYDGTGKYISLWSKWTKLEITIPYALAHLDPRLRTATTSQVPAAIVVPHEPRT